MDGNGYIKEIKVNNGTYENPVAILQNKHIGSIAIDSNDDIFVTDGNAIKKIKAEADGTGTNYDPADAHNNTFTMGDSDVTLYAKWIPTVTSVSSIRDITNVDKVTDKMNIGLPAKESQKIYM